MQVVSGPVGRQRVHFGAPPAERLDSETARFLAWANRASSEPPLVKDRKVLAGHGAARRHRPACTRDLAEVGGGGTSPVSPADMDDAIATEAAARSARRGKR